MYILAIVTRTPSNTTCITFDNKWKDNKRTQHYNFFPVGGKKKRSSSKCKQIHSLGKEKQKIKVWDLPSHPCLPSPDPVSWEPLRQCAPLPVAGRSVPSLCRSAPCRSSWVEQETVQILRQGLPVPPEKGQQDDKEQGGQRAAARLHQRDHTVRHRGNEHQQDRHDG